MFEKLNVYLLIGSFAIGMLFVYMMPPKYEVVMKFPNVYNVDDMVYRDQNNLCYKYKYVEVPCTSDAVSQPVMEGMANATSQSKKNKETHKNVVE